MRQLEPSYIGIDLHDSEIRVVQVRNKSGVPKVLRVATAPMPPAAMVHGVVHQPAVIALAVRRLIQDCDTSIPARAVIGITGSRTILRALSVPPCPEPELPSLVNGEVEYQQVIPDGGMYGFVRLHRGAEATASEDINVAVLGVDGSVVNDLREIAEGAAIPIEALEPCQLGTYRAFAATQDEAASSLLLLVSADSTDLVLAHDGKLCFYRRIDVGSSALLLEASDRDIPWADGAANSSEPEFRPAAAFADSPSAVRFATEVMRTMEYLAREYPEFSGVDRVRIAVDSPALSPLGDMVSFYLGIPVELVQPSGVETATEAVKIDLEGPNGTRYLTALGLALQASPGPATHAPKMDLSRERKDVNPIVEFLKAHRGPVLASGGALFVGACAFLLFGSRLAAIEKRTASVYAQTTAVRGQTVAALEEQARRAKQYRMLSKEGVPITFILDDLARSLTPGVGVSTLAVSPDLRVSVTGDAANEASMIGTFESLKTSPLLKGLSISSFDRGREKTSKGITFQFSGSTLSLDQIKIRPLAQADVPSETTTL
jgi:Tfp pilus assembly PilM family ATPase